MLNILNLNSYYGDVKILWDVCVSLKEKEIVSIVGANGAGKTTLLKSISGAIRQKDGTIEFMNRRIDHLEPDRIVEMGVIRIPEGRKIFSTMTVEENLELGSFNKEARKSRRSMLEKVFEFFPVLEEKKRQMGGTLSGGEQQMLALGRGLMSLPKLLMLDEPSLGLGPLVVKKFFDIVKRLNDQGLTILLVEQNIQLSLSISERGYVLENGKISMSGKGEELLMDEYIKEAYIGM